MSDRPEEKLPAGEVKKPSKTSEKRGLKNVKTNLAKRSIGTKNDVLGVLAEEKTEVPVFVYKITEKDYDSEELEKGIEAFLKAKGFNPKKLLFRGYDAGMIAQVQKNGSDSFEYMREAGAKNIIVPLTPHLYLSGADEHSALAYAFMHNKSALSIYAKDAFNEFMNGHYELKDEKQLKDALLAIIQIE